MSTTDDDRPEPATGTVKTVKAAPDENLEPLDLTDEELDAENIEPGDPDFEEPEAEA